MTQIEQIKAEIERLMNWKPKAISSGMRQRDVLNIRKGVLLTLKDFINSLPAEQLSEELEKETESYLTTNRQYAGGDEEDLWGDDCIRDAIKHGAQWQKQRTLNKARKWLAGNVIHYIWKSSGGGIGISDEFFIDFEKAMEE